MLCTVLGPWINQTAEAQLSPPDPATITTQPLAQALTAFAKQTGLQVVYLSQEIVGASTRGAPEGLTPRETLMRLLADTGLTFEFLNERTVRIYPTVPKGQSGVKPTPPSPGNGAVPQTSTDTNTNNDIGNLNPVANARETKQREKSMTRQGLFARLGGLFALCGSLAHPDLACAQAQVNEVEPAKLEEVIVTARKSEENLMTVPASVSALSATAIEDINIKDMTEITNFEPSFRMVNGNAGAGPAVIRGSNTVTFRGLVETGGSGSVFIDGAPAVDGVPPTLDEVERVEVLKGPQSAYFGRSTFAGAINFITKDPSLTTLGGVASAEASSYSSTDTSLGLSFPIINDVLGLRLSGRHHIKGGEYVNSSATDQVMGEEGTDSYSATLLFKPNDKLTVKAWASWMFELDGPEYETGINSSDGFFNFPSPAAATFKGGYIAGPIPNVAELNPANISCVCTITPFLYNILKNNVNNYILLFNPHWFDGFGNKRNEKQDDLRVDYEFLPGYTVTSLTAYEYFKSEQVFDIDNRAGYAYPNPFYPANPNTLPYLSFDNETEGRGSSWSEEVRFTSPQDRPLTWTVGGSYLYNWSPGSSLISEFAVGPADFGGIATSLVRTPAIFAGVHYTFLPKLTLSVEGRYQWDKITNHTIYVGNTLVVGSGAVPLEATFRSFSPRVSLDYKYAPDSTAYVLFSRGYKPGGFNTAVATNTPAQNAYVASQGGNGSPTYDQERLDNYEFGVKSTFLDDRARIAVSFYYDKWLDGQVPDNVSVPANPALPIGGTNTTHIESPVTNAGLIILKGIEFEGDLQATSHLIINSSFALNNTDVRHYVTCSDCVQILGTTAATGHVPNAPKWSAAAGATYTDHLISDWNWYGRIDYTYQGSRYVDYTNLAWTQAANRFNLHWGAQRDKFRVEAFVNNLTNNSTPPSVDRITNGFYFFTTNQNSIDYTLPDKRTFGVRADYKF